MAHSIPIVPLNPPPPPRPPPAHLSGSRHFACPCGGDLSENLCLGMGR